jgi:hypothetical protein
MEHDSLVELTLGDISGRLLGFIFYLKENKMLELSTFNAVKRLFLTIENQAHVLCKSLSEDLVDYFF